ncbi:uncharacterized protein TRIADDRAFT_25002 [Trichoplax adhaerens]|uniref:Transcriptional regulator ATRX n=1 Tax=Trichoplax adhaerens TaxID=10228 RepID=B3RYH6_TRIAD|nr:hypothetical protein TRIADDRAFT_25002 [Trichoplax adhaerens]EDV24598.1 hypothetical protein TRIADDRAFT_25002 [Trichoplax adhaerens]|eukprot:XP_002112488.1 hypothetical protein TRIADDRAFT_25002 [Trichoplax adhaerens]
MEIIASSKDKENTHHTNNVEDRKSPPNATHEDDSPSTVCLKKNSAGRKKIRRVLNYFELDPETRAAAKEEKKRLDRIKDQKRSKTTSSATNSQVDDFILEKHDNKKIVYVQSFISKHLKAHQKEGIKFMWTSCIESVDRIAEPGSGCIIAHSMGLGKTLQVIAFIDAVLNYGNESIQSVLVVCPKNVLLNWALEFKKWLKRENSYSVHTFSATLSSTKDRLRPLRLWNATKGLMIISYNMYTRLLSPDKSNFDRSCNDFLTQVLLEPGPDIVICDEGHLLKSQKTKTSEILNRIRTKRRIILTGTPLQNNLSEYYYMVNFVKPRLLGSMSEFKNRFINPIRNGLHADSTRDDVKYMKKRTYVLNLKVKAFVQRYDYDVLESELPPKHEYVIYIRMSRKQCELYKSYLEKFASDDHLHFRTYSLFGDFSNLTSIWTYPWNWKRDNNNSMTDMVSENDEVSTVSDGGCSTTWKDSSLAEDCDHLQNDTGIIDATRLDLGDTTKGNENDSANTRVNSDDGSKKAVTVDQLVLNTTINSASDKDAVDRHKKRWLEQLAKVPQEDLMTYCNKMKVVVKIIDLAYKLQEKVIIFSHSLCCLTLIEEVLRENCTPSLSYEDYCRMDGRTSAELRQRYIDKFNNSNSYRCRVFLISTRAGSLGINLTAASRVVLFDVGWNPSYDMQAIFRAYRFGQKKTVYVYRLVAKGTMEQKIYERQVTKQSLAYRVIDKRQIERHYTMSELQELYAFTPEPDNLKTPLVPQDQILAEIIQDLHPKILLSYHEHDSLLKNIESEKLTEDERKAAWEEYKADET